MARTGTRTREARGRGGARGTSGKSGWRYSPWIGVTYNGIPVGIIAFVVVLAVLFATGVL